MRDFLPRIHFEEEHNMFRDMIRDFIEKEITPNVECWHKEGQPDREILKKADGLGLIGMSTPGACGDGGEMDFRCDQVLNEGLSNVDCDSIIISSGVLNNLVAPYLIKSGNEEQKQKYLAFVNASDTIDCLAMAEPDVGSDLVGIRIFVKKNGDHCVPNDTKVFIPNGIMADFVLVAATIDPSKGRAGISMLIVGTDLESFTRTGPLQKVGPKIQDATELNFDNVHVPIENLLGEEDAAFGYLHTNLARERLTLTCDSVATFRHTWTLAYRHIQKREASGRLIIQHQIHGHYLAGIATHVTALRAPVGQVAVAYNAGQLDETGTSMAKYWITERQQDIITHCLQVSGGYDFMFEYLISTHYLSSKVRIIYGNTNEIIREIIFCRVAKGGAE